MATVLAALLGAAVLAGCGSGTAGAQGAKGASKASSSAFLRFAQCMRGHGVPNFPDPSGGGGIHIQAGSGANPASPAFRAARAACRALLPGGGPSTGAPTAQQRHEMLQISRCMRAHGVTDFPDPTTSPPADPADYSIVLGRGGLFLELPKTMDVTSPAFKRAAGACRFGR